MQKKILGFILYIALWPWIFDLDLLTGKKKIIKCDKIQFKRYTHLYLLIYAPVMLCIVIEFKACFYSANEK